MINIKTKTNTSFICCPNCRIKGQHIEYIFQGIHTSEKFECHVCRKIYIIDLPIGHSLNYGFEYNITDNNVKTQVQDVFSWFIKPYKKSLDNPNDKKIKVSKITNKIIKRPLILNCIDYLYGHTLLKLLNAERHFKDHSNYDLIAIIPKSLLWLVPKQVAQIIVVDIRLEEARNYYPSLSRKINMHISHFSTVNLSKAYAHPNVSDISFYTKQKSCVNIKKPRITFIWRNDRPWFSNIYITYIFKKLGIISIINFLQYIKIITLFSLLHIKNHKYLYTVAGFGKQFNFPRWINDQRVNIFSKQSERKLCKVYAESKIVIGVHGSSMLLPSAHSHMILDLIPDDRLGNFAQDIIYELKRANDFRIKAFDYRYSQLSTSILSIYKIVISMIKHKEIARKMFASS